MTGQVPNVVFPGGLTVSRYRRRGFALPDSELRLYYGAADTVVGLATTTVADLLAACDVLTHRRRSNCAPSPRKAFLVSHTHWDREWYLTFNRFRVNLVEVVDRVLDALDHDPEFRHFVLDGQSAVLEDYLEAAPDQRDRVDRLVREGRLAVGPWYILPDEFLVSGEATVRNLMFGRKTAPLRPGAEGGLHARQLRPPGPDAPDPAPGRHRLLHLHPRAWATRPTTRAGCSAGPRPTAPRCWPSTSATATATPAAWASPRSGTPTPGARVDPARAVAKVERTVRQDGRPARRRSRPVEQRLRPLSAPAGFRPPCWPPCARPCPTPNSRTAVSRISWRPSAPTLPTTNGPP